MTMLSATQTPYTRGWSPRVVLHPHRAMNIVDGCRRRILYDLTHYWLYCLWVLENCCFPGAFSLMNSTGALHQNNNSCNDLTVSKFKRNCLILMLLLLSGIQPNPGPSILCNTPADFKNMPELRIIHINSHSLLPKMDMVQIWAESTSDLIAVSEMLLAMVAW